MIESKRQLSSSPNDMSEQDYRPIKRIRQACQNCRRKKARCTGERPECAFCVRLGQHCSYSDDESPVETTFGGSSSKKTSTVRFQTNEKAGDGPEEHEPLSNRISALESQMGEIVQTVKGLESTIQNSLSQLSRTLATSGNASSSHYNGNPHHVKAEGGEGGNPGVGGGNANNPNASPYSRLPPVEVIKASVDLYFRYCHNQPYSLFHEAGIRNRVDMGEVPTHLLFALLASTVRYSSDPFFGDQNAAVLSYANQSWKAIVMPWNGIQSDGELSIVQTILLLAIVDYTEGKTQASWIKVGLAIRLAQDFRLMVEPDKTLSPIQQEERRRVFWSFYLCDKLISCGRERPSTILDDHCKLQLPGDENAWRAGHPTAMPTLEQLMEDNTGTALSALSPFATTIVIASLLGRCAQYALGEQEEQTSGGKMVPWNPRSKYSAIHSALLQHESELGLNEPLSGKIAQVCVGADGAFDQHRAAPLALSHALFYLCQCLLYHPFLLKQRLARVSQRTPQSFLTQTQNACRFAASALSRMMDDVKSLGCQTLTTSYDPFYGYCTMVAGVIHALFVQSADPLTRDAAASALESCVQNLKEMGFYWRSCSMMLARLDDFRAGAARYAVLVDPTVQEIQLAPADAADLLECLDYARMSTTPRRKSQGGKKGGGGASGANGGGGTGANGEGGGDGAGGGCDGASSSGDSMPALSQLPSPFFEELVNLLPLSYSRPVSTGPLEGIFSQPPHDGVEFGGNGLY